MEFCQSSKIQPASTEYNPFPYIRRLVYPGSQASILFAVPYAGWNCDKASRCMGHLWPILRVCVTVGVISVTDLRIFVTAWILSPGELRVCRVLFLCNLMHQVTLWSYIRLCCMLLHYVLCIWYPPQVSIAVCAKCRFATPRKLCSPLQKKII